MKFRIFVTLASIALVGACSDVGSPLDLEQLDVTQIKGGKGPGNGKEGDNIFLPKYKVCADQIDLIQLDLDANAELLGGRDSQRTYDGLTAKLAGAKTHLDQEKPISAASGLLDVITKVETLRDVDPRKPAMDWDVATLLLTGNGVDTHGAYGALACVDATVDL